MPEILPEDLDLRRRIREHARSQEGYDAQLYDLWEEWNDTYFEGRMVYSLIQLTDPGQTHRYGCCSTYSGLAGIRSSIKIRESILEGTLRDLKHGSRNPEGLRRFLEDVLLHEMVHQYHFEVTGQHDASYSGHGPAFSERANEIGSKLGLPKVGRTCKKRDCAAKGLQSPSQWPHDVRSREYYRGAYAPDLWWETGDPEVVEALTPVVAEHGMAAFKDVAHVLNRYGGRRVFEALERVPTSG